MSVFIGNNSGRLILGDNSQKVRLGHNSGSVVSTEEYEKEHTIIKQSTKPCAALSPSQANFEEIRSWIKTCECEHPSQSGHGGVNNFTASTDVGKWTPMVTWLKVNCSTKGHNLTLNNGSQSPLRLIDVEDQCIVEVYTPLRYFTLSYTWGAAEQIKLEARTLSQFMKKGGLALVKLPDTIRDSITLTSRLGERYLWVDVLCIIQDDVEENPDKSIQLARMCDIYTNAILTIVAGKGKDANAGLSRVAAHTKCQPRASEVTSAASNTNPTKGNKWISLLGGVWVMRAWTYLEKLLFKHSSSQSTVGDVTSATSNAYPIKGDGWVTLLHSVWVTRAWTYQETILSKRLLLVLEHRLELSCGHILFSEGKPKPDDPILDPRFEPLSKRLSRCTGLAAYEHAVSSYSCLNLGREEDILFAFDGILSRLRPYLRSGYIYGLPDRELESALAWRTGTGNSNWTQARGSSKKYTLLRRRETGHPKKGSNPTWSWAGWVGEVHYNYNTWPIIDDFVTWIGFETLISDSNLEQGLDHPRHVTGNSADLRRGIGSYDGRWLWHHNQRNPAYFTHTSEPDVLFANMIAPEHQRRRISHLLPGFHNLLFITTAVSVQLVAVEDLKDNHHQRSCDAAESPCTIQCLPILDHEHFHAGMIDVSLLPTRPEDAKYPEFSLTNQDSELPFVTVMAGDHKDQEGLQLVVLSRFAGFANTIEPPHRYNFPSYHPSKDKTDLLNNICEPMLPPFADGSSDIKGKGRAFPDSGSKIEDEHRLFPNNRVDKNNEHQPFLIYDTRRYQKNKYYPFYSVLLIEWKDGIAYRLGSGQVHIDAFHYANPISQIVTLA